MDIKGNIKLFMKKQKFISKMQKDGLTFDNLYEIFRLMLLNGNSNDYFSLEGTRHGNVFKFMTFPINGENLKITIWLNTNDRPAKDFNIRLLLEVTEASNTITITFLFKNKIDKNSIFDVSATGVQLDICEMVNSYMKELIIPYIRKQVKRWI